MDITGKSDPFVVVSVGTKSYKSRVVYQNLNPVWNEMFEFEDFTFDMDVIVRMYDWDLLGSALLRPPLFHHYFSISDLRCLILSGMQHSTSVLLSALCFGRGNCEPASTFGFCTASDSRFLFSARAEFKS